MRARLLGTSQWKLNTLGVVMGHQRAGPGLLYIRLDDPSTTRRILVNPMHQVHGGTVAYQPWVQGFNPCNPKGLLTPFWISFPSLPLEYHTVAAQVGKILAEDINLERVPPARFCVGIDISQDWTSFVVGNSVIGSRAIIPISYDGFELECVTCVNHAHSSAECPRLQSNPLVRHHFQPQHQGPILPTPQGSGGGPQHMIRHGTSPFPTRERHGQDPAPANGHRGRGARHRYW